MVSYLGVRTAIFDNVVLDGIRLVVIGSDPTSSGLEQEIVALGQHHAQVNVVGHGHFKGVVGDGGVGRVFVNRHSDVEFTGDRVERDFHRLSADLTQAQGHLEVNRESASKAGKQISLNKKLM